MRRTVVDEGYRDRLVIRLLTWIQNLDRLTSVLFFPQRHVVELDDNHEPIEAAFDALLMSSTLSDTQVDLLTDQVAGSSGAAERLETASAVVVQWPPFVVQL